jgi:hypothetical protein
MNGRRGKKLFPTADGAKQAVFVALESGEAERCDSSGRTGWDRVERIIVVGNAG